MAAFRHREDEQTRIAACLPQRRTNMHPCKRDPIAHSPNRLAALAARLLRHRLLCTERRMQSIALVLDAKK